MNWLIPKKFSDRPRERAVAAIFIKSFVVVVIGFALTLMWLLFVGSINKTIEWVLLSGIVIISLLLLEFRYSGSWLHLGYGLLLPGAIAVSIASFQTGGIKSPILIWLMLGPSLAFATIGQKFGIAITGIINLVVVALYAYEMIYIGPATEIHGDPTLHFVTLIVVMNLLVLISFFLRKEKILDMRELNVATDAKNMIFEIIGHDLRGPIGGMTTSLDLLTREGSSLTEEERETLTLELKMSSKSTLHLLENLLFWARSEQGHFLNAPADLNLHSSIREILDLFSGQIKDKNISIDISFNLDLQVYADRTGLSLILRNLISNAIKFTSENGTISIQAVEKGPEIFIGIKDNGVGMKPDAVKSIFNEKIYASTRGTDNEVGSGLGLKIVKKFVEANGGNVTLESEEGEGSCFTFSLPKSST